MSKKRSFLIIGMLLILLAGCQLNEQSKGNANELLNDTLNNQSESQQTESNGLSDPEVEQEATSDENDTAIDYSEFGEISDEQWKHYTEKIIEIRDLFTQSSLSLSLFGRDNEVMTIRVRKTDNPHVGLTKEEETNLIEAIYDEIGERFPLTIESSVIGGDYTLTGNITHMEKDRQVVLIVDQNSGQDEESPDAYWAGVSDTTILKDQDGNLLSYDDLEIGQFVQGWKEGITFTSYPGQTGAIELIIDTSTAIEADFTGVIDQIEEFEDPNWEAVIITIDEKQFLVSAESWIWIGDDEAAYTDLQVGQKVTLWTTGLPGEPSSATQIIIE